MNLKLLALAAVTAAGLGSAQAAEIGPASAGTVDLGSVSGTAYYTAERDGYHVVVTLAPRAAAPALRFEATLAAGQSVTLSTPRMPGEPAEMVEIARAGDRVSVSEPRRVGFVRAAEAMR